MKLRLLFLCVGIMAFAQQNPTEFAGDALKESLTAVDGSQTTFEAVLKAYTGKPILIDFWASWCPDCVKGLPKVKALQTRFKGLQYLFLSVDRKKDAWRKGIEKYDIKGTHYFIDAGWKPSKLCQLIKLDWIPRYMLVDASGNIVYFKAIKADDDKFVEKIKQL